MKHDLYEINFVGKYFEQKIKGIFYAEINFSEKCFE
jgi:hypothetical protein